MGSANEDDEKDSPPDGGWGWVIVFASFTIQALTIGVTYTFGVLFVALLEYFEEGESTTSWIGSIQPALLYFTGIFAGPLIRKFGWRKITIAGAFISALGFCSSALVPNIYLMYFTYGVLTGIGNGLMYVTSMVAVQHYFDKKRAMATGLAVSGSGVGTLVFGFLTQTLLDSFGWRWTLVVEGSIMLLGVICGLTYKPLPSAHYDNDDENKNDTSESKTDHPPRNSVVDEQNESTPLLDSSSETTNNKCISCKPCNALCNILKDIFDIRLWTNPVYLILCFSILMFCFGYHVPFTYTPVRAETMYDIPAKDASFLISIMGIANVLSRLTFGWIADKNETIRFVLAGVMLTLGGAVSTIIFFVTSYPFMIAYSALFGCFTGCWAALFPVILVDLMGINIIEKALGQAYAVGSVAFLVASPMSGWIIQMTDSYNLPFMVVGAAETLGGICFFLILCFKPSSHHSRVSEAPPSAIDARINVLKRQRISYVSESFA